MRDDDLPADRQETFGDLGADLQDETEDFGPPPPSLTEEIAGLVSDGRTYVEAEIAFQKSRLRFAAGKSKGVLLYGVMAFGFVHLGLIALVVGAVIALAPIVGGVAATVIVAGVMMIIAAVLLVLLRNRAREIGDVFEEDRT